MVLITVSILIKVCIGNHGNHVINVQRIQGVKEDYKLSAYGKIPLAALYTTGYLDANDSKAMDMTIDFNEADMAVIPLITPTVKEATGALKGLVHVTGDY